ncbi:galactoside 2-alpha-L-fucosyltransferase Sec1-like [Oratosquilla oratoria]|uniref:galactoside 2-alpha-L-fucosyltransferase Sec1-like n=1 Tax=Oratosquilla oratoria TaxID=337810 RepID=UPI003F76D4AC
MKIKNKLLIITCAGYALYTILLYINGLDTLVRYTKTKSISQETVDNFPKKIIHEAFPVNCSLPWIVQRLRGRLGNQMCEAASLLTIRRTHKVQVALETRIWKSFSLVFWNSSIRELPKDCQEYMNHSKEMTTGSITKYLQRHNSTLNFNVTVTDVPCNFHQFWKYRKDFIKEFKFTPEVNQVARERQVKIIDQWRKQVRNKNDINITKKEMPVVVGVHVRRTDYARFLNVTIGGKLIEANYFHTAFNWTRRRFGTIAFIVVSDDPDWCFKEIIAVHSDAVMLKEPGKPGEDLALLALSDHCIIDYGTYGMWGAFLTGGMVIYPRSPPKTEPNFLERNLNHITHPDILGLRYY